MKQSTFYINAWYSKLYRFIYGPEVRLTDITNKEIFVFKLLFGTLVLLPMLVSYNILTSLIAVYAKNWLIKNEVKYLPLKDREALNPYNLNEEEFAFYLKYEEYLDIYHDLRYSHGFPTLINSIFYLGGIIISSITYDLCIIIHGWLNSYNGLTYILNFNSPVSFKDDFATIGIASIILLLIISFIYFIGSLVEYILNKTDNKTIEIKPRNNIKWTIKS